jgi:hypothetical protein
MNEEQTNKPNKGTWDRLGAKDVNKISFDINISHKVTFLTDAPEEIESTESAGDVYYKFAVVEDGVNKTFSTSAWTLLGALKEIAPLKDKTVTITKKLIKGKQTFEVSA